MYHYSDKIYIKLGHISVRTACIYIITLMIHCFVLTVYNILYKFGFCQKLIYQIYFWNMPIIFSQ